MPHAVDGSEIRAVHWELNSHDARGVWKPSQGGLPVQKDASSWGVVILGGGTW